MVVVVVVRVRVGMGIGADALDVVVVALLRQADRGLVADHARAVLAQEAVHVDVARMDPLDPLDEAVEHQRVVAEVGGLEQLDLGMARRRLVGLAVDPPHQDAGEQEPGEHDDPAEAETRRALEQRIDARVGEPAVADLGPAEAHALPQHPRDLGDVAVGVGVRGAAPDHREQRLGARHRGGRLVDRFSDPVARRGEQLGVDAEVAAEVDLQAMQGGVGVQHRGHVVLDVAGGEQHARHREHVAHALRPQAVEAVVQDRPRELEEAALDRVVRQARDQARDQALELGHRVDIARAVAAHHDPNPSHRRPSR